MTVALQLSQRARQTDETPISFFMQQGVENKQLISLAAGLVDPESLPADEVRAALAELLAEPAAARAALQYGTTQGHAPLRDRLFRHMLALDGLTTADVGFSADDVVVT